MHGLLEGFVEIALNKSRTQSAIRPGTAHWRLQMMQKFMTSLTVFQSSQGISNPFRGIIQPFREIIQPF